MEKESVFGLLEIIDSCLQKSEREVELTKPDSLYALGKMVAFLKTKTIIQDFIIDTLGEIDEEEED